MKKSIWGEKNFFWTPLPEKTGAKKGKTLKMTNFRPKTRYLAKNYNFPAIIFQFIGFLGSKKPNLAYLPPISKTIDHLEQNIILRRLKIIGDSIMVIFLLV